MSFENRLHIHNKYLKKIYEEFQEMDDLRIGLTGLEHTFPKIQKILIKYDLKDFTSKWMRYQPDGILVNLRNKYTTYFDAKAADNIEKRAYEIYKAISMIGCNMVLYIKSSKHIEYEVPFEKLVIEDGRKTVSQYSNPFPVDESGWICPRKSSSQLTDVRTHITLSGTPYKRLSFAEMESYKRESGQLNLSGNE